MYSFSRAGDEFFRFCFLMVQGPGQTVNAPERLSDAFIVYFGPSSGPEVLLFKRFQDKNGASSTTMSLNPEQLQHQDI